MPLVLKLFIHQDVQQVVESKTDRIENRYETYPAILLFLFTNTRVTASFISATFVLGPARRLQPMIRKKKRKARMTRLLRPSSEGAHLRQHRQLTAPPSPVSLKARMVSLCDLKSTSSATQ